MAFILSLGQSSKDDWRSSPRWVSHPWMIGVHPLVGSVILGWLVVHPLVGPIILGWLTVHPLVGPIILGWLAFILSLGRSSLDDWYSFSRWVVHPMMQFQFLNRYACSRVTSRFAFSFHRNLRGIVRKSKVSKWKIVMSFYSTSQVTKRTVRQRFHSK